MGCSLEYWLFSLCAAYNYVLVPQHFAQQHAFKVAGSMKFIAPGYVPTWLVEPDFESTVACRGSNAAGFVFCRSVRCFLKISAINLVVNPKLLSKSSQILCVHAWPNFMHSLIVP